MKNSKYIVSTVVLISIGVGFAFVLKMINSVHGYDEYFTDVFIIYLFPSGFIISIIFGFLFYTDPWRWPLILLGVFYISTLVLLPGAGELLPIELIFVGIIDGIYTIGAYMGRYVNSLSRR